jgi:hypothetical protein
VREGEVGGGDVRRAAERRAVAACCCHVAWKEITWLNRVYPHRRLRIEQPLAARGGR